MNSATLLLVVVPLLLALIAGAVKFMRLVSFVASGGKRSTGSGRGFDDQLGFDERVAERLRELQRERQ